MIHVDLIISNVLFLIVMKKRGAAADSCEICPMNVCENEYREVVVKEWSLRLKRYDHGSPSIPSIPMS